MSSQFFKNKNVLIAGATFGIGEAIALELGRYGANLFLTARSEEKLIELTKNQRSDAHYFQCDFAQETEIKNLFDAVYTRWQSIDIIIFSIGTYQPMGFADFDKEQCHKIIKINLTSFVDFLGVAEKGLKTGKIKHLAVLSSIASYFGMPNSMLYGASKSALSHLTESLYYELKAYDVKIQLINPGFVKTRLTDQNNFPMPFLISSEKAAKIILKGLMKSKFEIAFPWLFFAIMKIISRLPYKIRFFLLSKL